MARIVLEPFPNVSVQSFEGLTVQFVRKIGARVILRGLRTLSDMEYEFGMTLTNHRLDPEVETVFLMAGGEYSHVSSTLVKQVAYFGGPRSSGSSCPRHWLGRSSPRLPAASVAGPWDEQVTRPLPHAQASRLEDLVQRAHGLVRPVEIGIGQPAAELVVLRAATARSPPASRRSCGRRPLASSRASGPASSCDSDRDGALSGRAS